MPKMTQTTYASLLAGVLFTGFVVFSVRGTAQEPQQQTVPLTTFLAEQEKVNAMSAEMVKMRVQIAQAPYMCITTVEKANPTKKVDPQTFVLGDKPVETPAPAAAPKK